MRCNCFLHRAERDERLFDVRDALLLGYTAAQAAHFGGVHYQTALRVARECWPVPVVAVDDPKKRAAEMLSDGASYTEIQRTLGVKRQTVRSWYPGRGWAPKKRGEFGAIRRQELALERVA